ncbi:MarR family winged helix-turn-helix transcriptional regulator [Streptococcus suis]|uniref:MarR family winged helix-turn-helix transcriptional regulator n=1 Tax=Streptococcus suis TaxID=1307 RepID=UPI000CF5C6D1|nr:MarR family transcriptional regulator [Streptococcus suis]HEM2810132.1 MarR family transcriptional regulator [Streptococcus suis]
MKHLSQLLYQVKLADEAVTSLFEKGLGISLTRYQILTNLLDQAPCSQQDLQEKLQIDRAAITRHLKILEDKGYIQRERNPENQREMLVQPTQYAVNDLQVHPPAHHQVVKAAMESILSDREEEQLSNLLEKLVSGLQHLPVETIIEEKGE